MARRSVWNSVWFALILAITLVSPHRGTAQAAPKQVWSPEELQDALANSTPHIVIMDHLDLRGLSSGTAPISELFLFPPATLSIRGDCASPHPSLSGATNQPALDLGPGQCLLLTSGAFGRTTSGAQDQEESPAPAPSPTSLLPQPGSLWMDNLFVQYAHSAQQLDGSVADKTTPTMLSFSGDLSHVWLTNVTLQGGGPGSLRALRADAGVIFYAQDSRVRHFSNARGVPVFLSGDGSISAFTRCSFSENAAPRTALVSFQHVLRLEDCEFDGNAKKTSTPTGTPGVEENNSFLFAKPPQDFTLLGDDTVVEGSSLEDILDPFGSLEDAAFLEIQEALPELSYSTAVQQAAGPAPESTSEASHQDYSATPATTASVGLDWINTASISMEAAPPDPVPPPPSEASSPAIAICTILGGLAFLAVWITMLMVLYRRLRKRYSPQPTTTASSKDADTEPSSPDVHHSRTTLEDANSPSHKQQCDSQEAYKHPTHHVATNSSSSEISSSSGIGSELSSASVMQNPMFDTPRIDVIATNDDESARGSKRSQPEW